MIIFRSGNFKEEKLKNKLKNIEDNVQEIWDYQIYPGHIKNRLIELEDRF